MKSKVLVLCIVAVLAFTNRANGQYNIQDSTYKKCFIGSTFFMLGNLLPTNKPDFVQLNLGYRLTGRDVVSIEFKTWKYAWSLGIPYGDSYEAPEEKFPGYIREFGIAASYQRYFWKGLYTGVHVMGAKQLFVNNAGDKVANGFQVFNTYRVGYHVKLFKDRFFIEPSIAVTQRAYHSKMPDSFKSLDDKWSKFFIGEPGLHFGYNF